MSNSHSEREILDLLRERYKATNPGNGPRYAIAEHVKSSAGFDARRQADMIVMDLWPGDRQGSGLRLLGHEVKCSRGDWLSELKDPSKADAFKRYMHGWYLVVSEPSIVRMDEVPADWGVIVRTPSGKLRAARKAPPLRPEPLPYTLLAPLLRATQFTGRSQGREEVLEHVQPAVCRYCQVTITLRADGKWEHETGTTSCRFEAGHRLSYAPRGTYRGAP